MTSPTTSSTAPPPAPVVDVHAHVLLADVEAMVAGSAGLAAQQQRELASLGAASAAENQRMTRDRLPLLVDAGARLAAMDAAGVDVQVVSPSPSQYHPWTDPSLAVEVAAALGEGVAAHCAQAPERLVGLGVAPLHHPQEMVGALEHAVLACGLRGVEIPTFAPDPDADAGVVDLSDERLEPFWRRAQDLGAVVMVHPFGSTIGARLDRWYLSNSVGQPMEHAVALGHVIFGGVLDRYPRLRLLATHGGGYLPAYLGRTDHAWTVRQDAHSCARLPSSYLGQVLLDSLVLDPVALRALVARAGADQVLLGSDFPFDMGDPDPLGSLRAAGLTDAETAVVAGGNAARLGLVPAQLSPPPAGDRRPAPTTQRTA